MMIRLLMLTFLIPVFVSAQELPERPDPPRLVNDMAGMISEQETYRLEQKLVNYHDTSSTQIAVVIIPELKGNDIADYSFKLAEKWGIGQEGKDNGVLILIAQEDRKMFIATGYGMEAIIPDAIAKRIIENYMKPHFRQGNYFEGLNQATNIIMSLSSGHFSADDIMQQKTKRMPMTAVILLLTFFLFYFFFKYIQYRSYKSSQVTGTSNLTFWTYLLLMSSMANSGRGYGHFSSGTGVFGSSGGGGGGFSGFGGGSFGGGGAGGSW